MSTGSPSNPDPDIAIIGLAGVFAGCANKDDYWTSILARRDQLRDAPDDWALPWHDPTGAAQGIDSARIQTRRVGLLGDLAVFRPLEFGIPPRAVEGDPAHYLALQLAGDALRDAGYLERDFDRTRAGIVVGHGSSPNRGDILGMQYGLVIDQTLDLLGALRPDLSDAEREALRAALKRGLPPLEIEQAPTLISNVISGRIANRLDLMGPNYLIDAACASSLLAADLGLRDLRSGRCDLMLVGGVQASMPAQIYMLFQQLGVLSPGAIRPFDARASGTLLGEGAGFAVLKRLPDAVRDDDRIYAVLKGVGIASDGKAMGLLTPRLEGEALAIRRAYAETGIDPRSIGLIEAHGTGIPLGDRTEIQALTQVFGPRRGSVPTCALGSVKSMIGHCIPAAGIASLIKTALALHHRILPPTLCDEVHPDLGLENTPFYLNTVTRPWIHGGPEPRRAGIDAFGFGGINAHAILEEYRAPAATPPPAIGRWLMRAGPPAPDPGLAAGASQNWPATLLTLSGDSRAALLARIRAVLDDLEAHPERTASAAATACQRADTGGPVRLAVVVTSRADLIAQLRRLLDKLPGLNQPRLSSRTGIQYAEAPPRAGQVALLFSSEGSQYPDMLAELAVYFPRVRGWFDFLDRVFPRDPRPSACIFPPPTGLSEAERDRLHRQLHASDLATESVSIASHALYELVRDLGVPCDVMVGHSAGEHVALRAAGRAGIRSLDQLADELRQLNAVYQALRDGPGIPTGCVLSVGALADAEIQRLLEDFSGQVFLVADNCPNQCILFVPPATREPLLARIREAGGIHAELPFDRAYHTPLFEHGVAALRRFYGEHIAITAGGIPVYSCSTAAPYPADAQATLDIAARQWALPVRFRDTIEALHAAGVRTFIELGASNALTAFVESILRGRDALAVAANVQGRPALEQFLRLLGTLYVNGIPVDLARLHDGLHPGAADRPGLTLCLKGELPRLSLDPDTIERLGHQHRGVASSEPADPPSGSPRAALLREHLALMRQFLDSQARIADDLLAGAAPDDRATP